MSADGAPMGLILVTFLDGSLCWLDVVQYLALDWRTVLRVCLRPDLALPSVPFDCHAEILAAPAADQ